MVVVYNFAPPPLVLKNSKFNCGECFKNTYPEENRGLIVKTLYAQIYLNVLIFYFIHEIPGVVPIQRLHLFFDDFHILSQCIHL